MSKMGISDVSSYRGARLFEAVGLDRALCAELLAGTPSAIGGARLERFEREALARLEASKAERPRLDNPGYYKFRKGGEAHATDADVVDALQAAVTRRPPPCEPRCARGARSSTTASRRSSMGRAPLEPRDLLELVPASPPVPLEVVEAAEEIVRRFSGGAMSHGALSAEAHETIAIALNRLGARSNSGEGGEDSARFRTERNSAIKQVASGRFGVTAEYAAFAEELQIKIAQGSKPGEGGQIPAHKVSEEIAALRRAQPGVSLISPPPHHDIYSIEDLAQLVFDLREVNPDADISVKLVAESGVGIVAAGVAKAHADVIHVGGADGGTGASPLPSIKHAGAPWEVGLAETQQALVANHLRGRVRLRVDGGFKTGRDVVVAALLGADEFSFGTALLLAEGLSDGALVSPRHLPGRDRDAAARAPSEVRGDPRRWCRRISCSSRRRSVAFSPRSGSARSGTRSAASSACASAIRGTLQRTRSTSRPSSCVRRRERRDTQLTLPRSAGDRLGGLLHAQGSAALESAALVELGMSSRTATVRSAPAWAVRLRSGTVPQRHRAASGRTSKGPRARASARSSRPGSSCTSSVRRTTTSARR
jgi:glutamate synthase domain-containing protein 2